MDNLKKLDNILENLIDMADEETQKMRQKGYFSKDFIEACGIIISLAYGRWGGEK